MGHSVGKAADNAVKRSTKTTLEERTPEQRIKAIRANLAAKLFVPPDEQRFLLQQCDEFQTKLDNKAALLQFQDDEIKRLQEKIEEFRTVYELENRRTSVKVGKFDETGESAVVSTVAVEGYPLAADLTGTVAQAISDSQ